MQSLFSGFQPQQLGSSQIQSIIEQLASPDIMFQFEGVNSLRNMLAIAQESQLSRAQFEQLSQKLVNILNEQAIEEIQSEIKLAAIQSLIQMLDISPNHINYLLQLGLTKAVKETIETSSALGYIDLVESCIGCLAKISEEVPQEILRHNLVPIPLNMIDFFDKSTQLKILALLLNISGSIQSRPEFEQNILVMMQPIQQLLQQWSCSDADKDKFEKLTTVIQRITKCFSRMAQAKVPEVKALHKEISQCGLYNLVADLLRNYTSAAGQSMETDAINTSSKKLFSKTAVSNLLLILQRPCIYSVEIAAQLIELGLFETLCPLLPAQENEEFDQSILQDTLALQQELIGSATISKGKEFIECADQKQAFIRSSSLIEHISQLTVPRLFVAYNLLPQNEHKERVLQLLCVLLQDVDAGKFTKFCYKVLKSQQPGQVQLCLQLIKGVKSQSVTEQFRRFGVQASIQILTDRAEVEKLCSNQQAESLKAPKKEDYQDIMFREHAQILKITEVQKSQVEARLQDFIKQLDEIPETQEGTKRDLKEQIENMRMKMHHLEQATEELRNLPKMHPSSDDSEMSFVEPGSQQTDIQTKIVELATEIQQSLFQNALSDNNQLSKLHTLAQQITQTLKSSSIEKEKWLQLFSDLKQTFQVDLTTFEFQESGLLEAINALLTNTRSEDESEECKAPGEQPQGHLDRLTYFCQALLQDSTSMKALVQLLHDQVSEAEKDIFPDSGSEADFHHSVDALQQLQRPIIIELAYRKYEDKPFQQLQASQSAVYKMRDTLFTKLGKIPIQISKADNCLILSDFLLRKVRSDRDVQDLLDRFARMPFSRKKIDPSNCDIQLESDEAAFWDELFALVQNLVKNSISQHVFIQSRAKFTEQSMGLIRKFESTGASLSNKFWDKLMGATAKAIKDHTLPPEKDNQASEAELELLLAQIEVKTEAFINLVQLLKNKSRPPLPPKKSEKEDVSMDEVLENSEKPQNEEENKSEHSQHEEDEEEPEDEEHGSEGSEDNYYEEQPMSFQDVEMTEEIGAKSHGSEDEEMSEPAVANQPLALEPKPSKCEDATSIDELIGQGSEDVEIEIYFQGKKVDASRPVFEVLRSQDNSEEKPKAEERQSIISQLLGSLRGGADMRTLEFRIKDKQVLNPLTKKNSLIEYKKSRTKSLIVEETPDFMKRQNFSVSVQQKGLKEALQVLKVLHFLKENPEVFSAMGVKILGGQDAEGSTENVKLDLQHSQIDRLFQRQIQDPYNMVTGGLPETLKAIFESCQFLFSFETRQLYLRCVQLIPVDLNRSITFLRQHLKSQGKQAQEEDPRKRERQERQRVKIDRNKSFVKQMLRVLPDLKGRALLEVLYKDEEGTGLGPTLEFYSTIATELKENKSLWRQGVPDGALYPKGGATQVHLLEQYKCAGYLIARAIFDDKLVDLPISRSMWDLLLQRRKMSIFDIKHLDPSLYDLMLELQLMASKFAEIKKLASESERQERYKQVRSSKNWSIEDYSLFFYDPSDDKIELVEGGLSLSVTAENLQEYIDLVLDSIFNLSVQTQLHAFKKGFELVMPLSCLTCLQTDNEIERLVCGQLGYDGAEWQINNLQDVVQTAHGFTSNSKAFRWFIQYLSEMDPKKRPQFIQFVTGSARLPHGGLAQLDPRLTVVMKKGASDSVLPSVMTCQNYVKMPDYSSYEVLRERFTTAVAEGASNFTLS